MKQLRLSLVGFGAVGQGLAELLAAKQDMLQQEYDLAVTLVSVATNRYGFLYREEGLDIPLLLELAAQKKPLAEHPGVRHWSNVLEGLRATGGDVLAEATWTNLRDAEPGLSHIRTALSLGMHVITANKGPVALAPQELLELASQQGVQLRMDATVMAGTPVLSTIQEGLAGSSVRAVRGILNGTTNYMLSAMAVGRSYADVLAEAQALGYAEADPTADVEGYDAVAKTLILAAFVFGRPLKLEQVQRRGITTVTQDDLQHALRTGKRIKLISSLSISDDGTLDARVEPMALREQDILAQVDGVMNAITIQTDTLAEVTIIGPGAGRLETGQGLLADLLAIARMQRAEG